jgi:hypothetical protein
MAPIRQRSYLKRKRILNNSMETIARTLRTISQGNGIRRDECDILQDAKRLASTVEAACFVSANKSSEERYRVMIAMKTAELCQSLRVLGGEHEKPPIAPMNAFRQQSPEWTEEEPLKDGICTIDEYRLDEWTEQ